MSDDPRPDTPGERPAPDRGGAAPGPPSRGRARGLVVLAASVVAGLIAWGLGESPAVRVAPRESNLVVMGQVTETVATTAEAIREAERLSAIRSVAAFGAVLGLAMGVVSGLTARGTRAAVVAGAVGLVAGGIAGAVAPIAALPLFEAMRTPGKQELLPVLLMHVALWAPVGAAAGLAFGLGRSSSPAPIAGAAVTGALGGAIGAVVFQVVGTLAFPLSGVDTLRPTTLVSRLASRLLVAASIGLVVGSTAAGPPDPNRPRGSTS